MINPNTLAWGKLAKIDDATISLREDSDYPPSKDGVYDPMSFDGNNVRASKRTIELLVGSRAIETRNPPETPENERTYKLTEQGKRDAVNCARWLKDHENET